MCVLAHATEDGNMFKSWKQPIQLPSHHGTYSYRATANQLKPHLYGIKETAKWPAEGLPKVMFKGIIFWVNPLGKRKKRDPDSHWRTWYKVQREGMHSRLMCACPTCDKTISYGRLAQHLRVHHVE